MIPVKLVVGPLPEKSANRPDGMRYLAILLVESEAGEEMVCDIDGSPTVEGAQAKGEGLLANFKPGHPAYEDALQFLRENGDKPS